MLMCLRVHFGFFVKQNVTPTLGGNYEEGGEGYLLVPASRLLLMEEPLSIRAFLLTVLNPIRMDRW
ncbi:putative trans-resveratrol di-O-methyltransferase [Helianthus anomalus]